IKATEHAAEEAKEEVTAVSENATVKAEEVKENVTEAAKSEEKKAPGFEGIFAIAGLLAIAGLVLSRRE
ncbi:MAG: PGF-CTERM sorting domain-containing protein, partial [Methanothrix sp.]|nr:PGF-CTERM sorting domain-containing protein [Methanothrix sp.]